MLRIASCALVAAVSLTACGADDPAPETAPNEVVTTPASSPQPSELSTEERAQKIVDDVAAATALTVITEDNDPNDLIGRPTGYVAAVVIENDGFDCDEIGVECGATIEEWPDAKAAKDRAEYIQDILKDMPMLGSEYHHLDGARLLRVSGEVKPSVAKEYEAAFTG